MSARKGGKIKVRIVTERRVLEVAPAYLRGAADRVYVDVCVECSAVVFDPHAHDTWHRSAVSEVER